MIRAGHPKTGHRPPLQPTRGAPRHLSRWHHAQAGTSSAGMVPCSTTRACGTIQAPKGQALAPGAWRGRPCGQFRGGSRQAVGHRVVRRHTRPSNGRAVLPEGRRSVLPPRRRAAPGVRRFGVSALQCRRRRRSRSYPMVAVVERNTTDHFPITLY